MRNRFFTTMRKPTSFATLSLLSLCLVLLPSAFAANSHVLMKTKLSGAAIEGVTPEGSAVFHENQNVTVLTVEVEQVNLAEGTVLDVSVSSGGVATSIGQITLEAGGIGELELNSRAGDTVPAIVTGDVLTVSAGGSAIMTGAF